MGIKLRNFFDPGGIFVEKVLDRLGVSEDVIDATTTIANPIGTITRNIDLASDKGNFGDNPYGGEATAWDYLAGGPTAESSSHRTVGRTFGTIAALWGGSVALESYGGIGAETAIPETAAESFPYVEVGEVTVTELAPISAGGTGTGTITNSGLWNTITNALTSTLVGTVLSQLKNQLIPGPNSDIQISNPSSLNRPGSFFSDGQSDLTGSSTTKYLPVIGIILFFLIIFGFLFSRRG